MGDAPKGRYFLPRGIVQDTGQNPSLTTPGSFNVPPVAHMSERLVL